MQQHPAHTMAAHVITSLVCINALSANSFAGEGEELIYRNGGNVYLVYSYDPYLLDLGERAGTSIVLSRAAPLVLGVSGSNVLGLTREDGIATLERGDVIGPVEEPWFYAADALIETDPVILPPESWEDGEERFAGFAVLIDGEPHYGWIRATFLADSNDYPIKVHDLAFHARPGVPVQAGVLQPQMLTVEGRHTLTAADFASATFAGTRFSLGPHQHIEVLGGGAAELPATTLHGTAITVADGGTLLAGGAWRDAWVTAEQGGMIEDGAVIGVHVSFCTQYVDRGGGTVHLAGGALGHDAHLIRSELLLSSGTVGDRLGVHWGSSLTVEEGVVGADVHVGQVIGFFPSMCGSSIGLVTMSGGSIGEGLFIGTSSTLNISGGSIGDFAQAWGAWITMSGGTIGADFDAAPHQGNTFNLLGGSVGERMRYAGTLNMSGGSIGAGLAVVKSVSPWPIASTINLDVTALTIDGEPADLIHGEFVTIPQRGGALLHAVLADGSMQQFVLNDTPVVGEDYFEPGTIIRARLLVLPGSPGDINGDGSVDLSDLSILLAAWGACEGACPADLNGDGVVNLQDLLMVLAHWG